MKKRKPEGEAAKCEKTQVTATLVPATARESPLSAFSRKEKSRAGSSTFPGASVDLQLPSLGQTKT